MSTVMLMIAASLVGQAIDDTAIPTPIITTDQYRKHVEFLASDELKGRQVDTRELVLAAEYIVEQWKQAGIRPPSDKGFVQAFWWKGQWGDIGESVAQTDPKAADVNKRITVRNLIGVLPGRGDLAGEAVVVSAHYDHVGAEISDDQNADTIRNGADDNASGVAVLLMLADQLSADRASLPDSHRTVFFTSFDAEERGLVGAKFYVEHPLWPLDKTAIVLNFDMVGRPKGKSVMCMDAGSCPKFVPVIEQHMRQHGFVAETRLSGSGRSDNAPFLAKQIPAIHFNTGIHVDYHQVTDEADRLNYEDAAKLAQCSYRLLRTAIAQQESFEYEQPKPQYDVQFMLGIAARLGIVPRLNAQNGIYPEIAFVVPGSPCAKAGMKSGDQLVAINGARLQRLEDAMVLLAQLNLRADLKLTMLRQREEVEVALKASVFADMLGPVPRKLDNGEFEILFRYKGDESVKTVHLTGSFNEWDKTSLPMTGPNDDNVFERKMVFSGGVYEYKFLLNGEEWKSDPANAMRVGQYQNSVLWIGDE